MRRTEQTDRHKGGAGAGAHTHIQHGVLRKVVLGIIRHFDGLEELVGVRESRLLCTLAEADISSRQIQRVMRVLVTEYLIYQPREGYWRSIE